MEEDETILQTAPSIEKLRETINMLSVVQLQSLYNALNMRYEMEELSRILTRMANFISKKEKELIGAITNQMFCTKWISPTIALSCPKSEPPHIPAGTNCNGERRYQDGVFV